MSYNLSMVEAKLPPGFRFHPRDDELICDYLTPKVAASSASHTHGNPTVGSSSYGVPILIDIDLNKCEPWDLPAMACVGSKEWYFFNLRDRKYATGQRTNRATMSGYWKATGKDRQIVRRGALVGMRKTLVFYQGRAPKGKKTDWVMHEFRLEGDRGDLQQRYSGKEDWVLCRVFYKSRGLGMTAAKLPRSTESCVEEDTGSSSLPPLTDNFIAFDRTFQPPPLAPPTGGNFTADAASFQQVPCFSSYPQINTPQQYIQNSVCSLPSCDKKVLQSVLDHFSRLEGNNHQQEKSKRHEVSPNMGQASSESYLTETALSSSMWYPFQG